MVLRGGSKGQVGAWVVWVAHQSDLVFVSMWASVCAAGLVFGLVFSRGCGSRGFVDDCLCNSLQWQLQGALGRAGAIAATGLPDIWVNNIQHLQ